MLRYFRAATTRHFCLLSITRLAFPKLRSIVPGNFSSTIVANTPNDGSFDWNSKASGTFGDGLSIRVSSLTNPVAVSDESDGRFSITDRDFPDGNAGLIVDSGHHREKSFVGRELDAFDTGPCRTLTFDTAP